MSDLKSPGRTALPVIGVGALLVLALVFGRQNDHQTAPGQERLRLAYFPNVTHAPAIVGVANGEFKRALGDKVDIDAKVFNAGPEAMEALLAREIDISYVGPGPAINTFLKSKGSALKVLAGACDGGASLLARPEANINSIHDLGGKRVAVPQFGGTQDISLRHFLSKEGLKPQEKGGTVQVLQIKNPDILTLFLKGELDAAWVPEPWAARLVKEAHAKVVVDERDLWPEKRFTTTVVVVRKDYLDKHTEQVENFLKAHLNAIDWIQKHETEAQTLVNGELKRLTGKQLAPDVLQTAWGHVSFTSDPNRGNIQAMVQSAAEAGYLQAGSVDVAQLLDMGPLEKAKSSVSASAK